MEKEIEYLMPDYYNVFSCKMGACRRACCEGWPITFSVEDYFRLMGCECTDDLRRKLDIGIKVSLSPTPDIYAQVSPRYDGSCPMRLQDGRCAIHAELGEKALSDVCRLYPRGLRIEPSYECSCANSCEAVLELLFSKDEPIRFIKGKCTDALPPMGKRSVTYPVFNLEQEIKLHLIEIIQNRNLPFLRRIISLGGAMYVLEEIIENQDEEKIHVWLKSFFEEELPAFEFSKKDVYFGINVMEEILEYIDNRSDSVREYGEKALSYFKSEGDVLEKYNFAKTHFESAFPKWETYFEHMITNHMFFEQFPFQDRPVSLWNEFISLCAVYSLMRFLSIGYMQGKESLTDLVDMFSGVFRLIDHTSFDSYASKTLKQLKCNTPKILLTLISL